MYSSGCNRLNTSARSPAVVVVDGPASFSTTAAAAMVVMIYGCIGRASNSQSCQVEVKWQ